MCCVLERVLPVGVRADWDTSPAHTAPSRSGRADGNMELGGGGERGGG